MTVLAFFMLIVVCLTDQCYSQDRYIIKSGCDLEKSGPQLLNYLNASGYVLVLQSDRKTTAVDILVTSVSVFWGDIEETLTDSLRNILKSVSSICIGRSLTEDNQEDDTLSKGSIITPISEPGKKIFNDFTIRFADASVSRYIVSPDYYVNPYFQAFGGDDLGLPFAYGPGVGMTAAFGTPYSGPMETDFVKGGIHLLIFDFSVTSRIKEFVLKYSSNRVIEDTRNTWIGNWNNLYSPHLGFEVSGELPFLKLSYFSTIDTLDETDPPVLVRNEVTGEPMKNNIVRGEYFGFELRTPNLIVANSTRAKFYFAKKFGEFHLGYVGREMKIGDFIFDFRLNATFPGKRDFQLLTELYFDSQWAGFANKAVGIGPSIRFGKTPSDNFGVITAFLNMRIKIGDFFDPELY